MTSTSVKPSVKAKSVTQQTGAFALIDSLVRHGVRHVFGYPGGAILPVYDELYKAEQRGDIQHILVRHEQAASHAADGYARATGQVGVCIATSGPGATNLVTGIATAQMDSVPMVAITGQVARGSIGSDAFQETDVVGCTTSITKWNFQITRVEEIPNIFAKAFYIANSGRPGPVVIDITKDAQLDALDFHYESQPFIRSYHPSPQPISESLHAAA